MRTRHVIALSILAPALLLTLNVQAQEKPKSSPFRDSADSAFDLSD